MKRDPAVLPARLQVLTHGELMWTAEMDQSFIHQLVELRATVARFREEASRAWTPAKAIKKLLDQRRTLSRWDVSVVLGIVTWLLDKIAPVVGRRVNHPELEIQRAESAGSSMTNPDKVYVNVALTLRNTGRAAAESYRAEARTRYGDGVSLTLRDPRNPRRRDVPP